MNPTPVPELPDPTPPQTLSVQAEGGLTELPKGQTGKHYTKEKATIKLPYDRYAWKAEVANVEVFLRDLIGERCYYVPRYEDGRGQIVEALAKQGPEVWVRFEDGEIRVVNEMHLHSVRNT